jgi:cytochrome c peroxidase
MHDGRFKTLEDVIEHYSHGIKNNPNLDRALRSPNGEPVQFNITGQQKKALVAFLNTLTDFSIVNSAAYSDPFNH